MPRVLIRCFRFWRWLAPGKQAVALFARSPTGSLLRAQIKGEIIPGLLGIGEPLIYGVALPRLKPFITACIGGGIGGFFIGLVAWLRLTVGLNTVFGPSGLVSIALMTSHQAIFAAGIVIVYIVGNSRHVCKPRIANKARVRRALWFL